MLDIDKLQKMFVDQGRAYPKEFITSMCITGGIALDTWLEENGAPALIIDLIHDLILLNQAEEAAGHGPVNEYIAGRLGRELPDVLSRLAAIGAEFHAPGSVCAASNRVTWAGPLGSLPELSEPGRN